MWPDRVSNPGPLIYESGALPFTLRGPALDKGRSGNNILKTRQELALSAQNHYTLS